jgi:hypothetical protein
MSTPNHEQNEELSLADFNRADDGTSVFIAGHTTPDNLTGLRQKYEGVGAASLKAQFEMAWNSEDDVAAGEILTLIQFYKKLQKEDN